MLLYESDLDPVFCKVQIQIQIHNSEETHFVKPEALKASRLKELEKGYLQGAKECYTKKLSAGASTKLSFRPPPPPRPPGGGKRILLLAKKR